MYLLVKMPKIITSSTGKNADYDSQMQCISMQNKTSSCSTHVMMQQKYSGDICHDTHPCITLHDR